MAHQIIFYGIAIIMIVCSIVAVTSQRILRSATFLLFVLIATAALYLQMGYEFLAGVQISVYAGGILVLYVFSILLTSHAGDKEKARGWKKVVSAVSVAVVGFVVCGFIIFNNVKFKAQYLLPDVEMPDMKIIGKTMMGVEKYEYLMPFMVLSILLLACIIGGIMIARKR